MLTQPEPHVLADGQGIEQGRRLKHHAAAVRSGGRSTFDKKRFAVDNDLTAVGSLQAYDMPQQDTFAGAGGADNGKGFSGPDVQRDVLEDMMWAKRLVEPFDMNGNALVRVTRVVLQCSIHAAHF